MASKYGITQRQEQQTKTHKNKRRYNATQYQLRTSFFIIRKAHKNGSSAPLDKVIYPFGVLKADSALTFKDLLFSDYFPGGNASNAKKPLE
jgi:hypothetical protein